MALPMPLNNSMNFGGPGRFPIPLAFSAIYRNKPLRRRPTELLMSSLSEPEVKKDHL